jgi:glycosyltransferase involved in cell wall biosynthesis
MTPAGFASSTGLVHDYLLVMRGAERTFAAMASCWPAAPIYTLLYDGAGTGGEFHGRRIHTSWLQATGVGQSGFRRLLPLFPGAARRLPVQEHDVVVSSSSAFAHGVRARADAVHVCYCHSPFRYAWFERERALGECGRATRPALRLALAHTRRRDVAAARNVTHYIANSQISRERIQRFWDRDATVIHPPVEVDRFSVGEPEDYLLVVGEVTRHKRTDVALEAARRAGVRIKVVGSGPDLVRLRGAYGATAEFLGRVSDERLGSLYRHARALVVPNVEEFGIAAVEAQASGRPVLAAAAGGALETVLDNETGVLVPPDDVDALAEALRETDFARFDSERIRAHAVRFSTDSFKQRLTREVARIAARVPVPEPAAAPQGDVLLGAPATP